ncbi:MAG: hypothetical protein JO057_08650 [Chloroflexi bacterium]|nr:hypothetical protein [Chloroflexota bacterium]
MEWIASVLRLVDVLMNAMQAGVEALLRPTDPPLPSPVYVEVDPPLRLRRR